MKIFGDVMLDKWILGTCDRISPEFPVPILLEKEVVHSLAIAPPLLLNNLVRPILRFNYTVSRLYLRCCFVGCP